MNLSLHSLVFLLATFNGLLFTAISFTKIRNNKNHLFIAYLLLLITIMMFDEFGRWTPDFFNTYPQFTFVFTFSWFLVVPVIYLWIRFQVRGTILKWYDVIHLLPVVIFQKLNNQFAIEVSRRGELLSAHFERPEGHIGKYFFSAQIAIYLIWIFIELSKRYNYKGVQLFKHLSNWLKAIIMVLVLYFVIIWFFIGVYEVFGIYLMHLDIWKTNLFLVFIYGWLFYLVYKPEVLRLPVRSVRIWKDQFDLTSLSPDLNKALEKIMEEKLFLKGELSLVELSKGIGITGRRLTDMVNKELKLSVPQLVNLLRINEMEKCYRSEENQNITLEGLAEKVGFKSRASFYRSFKAFTGDTPSHYFDKLK